MQPPEKLSGPIPEFFQLGPFVLGQEIEIPGQKETIG
jgi:hypothetical protein